MFSFSCDKQGGQFSTSTRGQFSSSVDICVTCIGTRNKKHLEFNARRMVIYPLSFGLMLMFLSVWMFPRLATMNILASLQHVALLPHVGRGHSALLCGIGQYLEVSEDMPIQLTEDCFLEYQYTPDYLLSSKHYSKYLVTSEHFVEDTLGKTAKPMGLVIDGGNVVKLYGRRTYLWELTLLWTTCPCRHRWK